MTIGGVRAGSRQGEAADLRAGDARGSHRAGQVRLTSARACSAGRWTTCWPALVTLPASSIRRSRPTRSRSISSGPIRIGAATLEEWLAGRQGDARLLVAALDQVAGVAFRRHGGGARAGRHARRYRGRTRLVCGSESIGPADLSVGQAQPSVTSPPSSSRRTPAHTC